jgi:methionyl-tRNA formyltransferase
MFRILLLASRDDPAKDMVYNAINPLYEISLVILEKPVNKLSMIKRRVKKLGIIKVLGQLAFQTIVVKLLTSLSKKRRKELMKSLNLNTAKIPAEKIEQVDTINDDICLEHIRSFNPDLILVKGTRIISKKILSCTKAPFINMHVGITPRYRGVHGAYWALANKDRGNAGTTIHYVDAGIDTGNIIAQQTIGITSKDNFVTYPLLQIAAGIELLKSIIPQVLSGNKNTVAVKAVTGSRLWYHPTIWYYLRRRIFNGVK